MRLTKVFTIVAALALLLFGAMSAQGAFFDFDISGPQPAAATISYAGGTTPLVGSAIRVAGFFCTGTLHDGSYTLTNGLLNFGTGNYSSSDPLHWNFGSGGFITLDGTVNGVGIPVGMSGSWLDANVFQSTPLNTFHITGGAFVDSKGESFSDYFGIGSAMGGNLNLSFDTQTAIGPGNDGSLVSFSTFTRISGFSSVGSGDLTNVVPVPPTALLLGGGLLGLVALGWRRRRS